MHPQFPSAPLCAAGVSYSSSPSVHWLPADTTVPTDTTAPSDAAGTDLGEAIPDTSPVGVSWLFDVARSEKYAE